MKITKTSANSIMTSWLFVIYYYIRALISLEIINQLFRKDRSNNV